MVILGFTKIGSIMVRRWQEIVKVILLSLMTFLVLVTLNLDSEVANHAVKAALLALMAATTFLVGNLVTQGPIGSWLDFGARSLAGAAAFSSAVHWIASETEAEAHPDVVLLQLATATIGFAVLGVLPVLWAKFAASTQDTEQ